MKMSVGLRFLLLVAILGGLILASPGSFSLTTATVAHAAPVTQETTVYVVQQGDSLAAIARRFGTMVTALIQLNGITNPNRIYTGQRLVIPVAGSTTPTLIIFAAGATSANRDGAFAAGGGSKQYILSANAGQVMEIAVSSTTAPVSFTVKSPGTTQWVSEQIGFDGSVAVKTVLLPQNGDYLITLTSVNAAPATNFTINVTIITPSVAGAAPERINFAAGSTEANRRGALVPGGSKRYLLNATRGQTMQVNTIATSVPVSFTIQRPSGTAYTADLLGSEVYIFAKTVILPEDGDYLVTLTTPADRAPTLYEIRFHITGASRVPIPPQRITFAAGATSTTVNGTVTFPQQVCYVLGAQTGQEMVVQLAPPSSQANFLVSAVDISGIGGFPLKQLENEERTWSGSLPTTTDYLICVATPAGAVSYSLTVTIPPVSGQASATRIQFPLGGTSATVTGQTSALRYPCYVLGASANQLMNVIVTSPSNVANFSLVGADGSPLKRVDIGQPSFSVRLPLAQDYTICVGAPAGTSTVDFTVFVAITN